MYTKSHLFYIDKLKPSSVEESQLLIDMLVMSVIHYLNLYEAKEVLKIEEIYCNRKSIYAQCDYSAFHFNNPEYFTINMIIKPFIEDLINSYTVSKNKTDVRQLSLEVSLLSKHNVVLSYDFY